jgi:hypothetical protein
LYLIGNTLRRHYKAQPVNDVYCENHTEHTDTVRTSQETHYVSATGSNRLMLFRETVAVYCENHTEHTDIVPTSQEKHYVAVTKPNRLMLFGETVAVYCENHTEHTDTPCGTKCRSGVCGDRYFIKELSWIFNDA